MITKHEDPSVFAPFSEWSSRGRYFFGLKQKGNEWHVTYQGGGVYEIDHAPRAECCEIIYRGKIPSREFFLSVINNMENPPQIN